MEKEAKHDGGLTRDGVQTYKGEQKEMCKRNDRKEPTDSTLK